MRTPHYMNALMDRGGKPTVRELVSSLVFNPADGTIRLNGDRLVMQRAAFGAELCRQLVGALGEDESRAFLIRLGFQLGGNDARFVRQSWPKLDVGDAFTAGTRLHTFSGIVGVETVHNDYDFAKKFFSAEFLWHDSVEAAEHAKSGQTSPHSVCWTQLGYASGHASEFFNTLIVYKEVSCAAEGHTHCRVIGKPAEAWGEDDPEVKLFRAQVLLSNQPGIDQPGASARMHGKVKPQRGSSAVDRVLLAPVVEGLGRLAATCLPVLICGASGTGKKRAAAYLHAALGAEGSVPLRLYCGGLAAQTLAQHLAVKSLPARRKTGAQKMLLLDDIELLPADAQALLAGHLGDTGERDSIVVAATTTLEPRQLASVPGFRHDLWLRFSVHPIRLASLSSRREDLPLLAEAMVSSVAERLRITRPTLAPGATEVLTAAPLTGNLTELEALLTAAILVVPAGTPISPDALLQAQAGLGGLSQAVDPAASFDALLDEALLQGTLRLDEIETRIYRTAVDRAAGNLSAAARALGISRAQLAYRLDRA
jgi:Activator of aromatic catabolism/V4R domain/Bacterial regulatory protein, Fis family/Sigma-54 interaction domain